VPEPPPVVAASAGVPTKRYHLIVDLPSFDLENRVMRRLPPVLPLLAAWGCALVRAQTPDSTLTFTTVDTRIETLWCTDRGCGPSRPETDPPPPPPVTRGVPFGPVSLWNDSHPKPAPVAFTASQNYTSPRDVIPLIASVRAANQSVILALTGGPLEQYTTDGTFDLAKWERRMDQYNTTPIRDAIAAGVADGTVLANSLIDEPENKKWGGVVTKPLVDSMAAYAKRYFPTLPMGPSHGPNGYYQWRPTERYRVVDYVRNQYNWWITKGDVAAWRDQVLAQAKLDGVGVAFSMNILDGGQPAPRDGTWTCPSGTSEGRGTRGPACRMTAAQIRDWGKALGPSGCALLMWRYDSEAMERPENVDAMRDVLAALAEVPRRACGRA
jgi:hypothetical protein